MHRLLPILFLLACAEPAEPPEATQCDGITDYFEASGDSVRASPARFEASTWAESIQVTPEWEDQFEGRLTLEAYACDHAGCWAGVEISGVARGFDVDAFHVLFAEHQWCSPTDTQPLRFAGIIEIPGQDNARVSLTALTPDILSGEVVTVGENCNLSEACVESPVGSIVLTREL